MSEIKLSVQEKILLAQIVNDKYSVGSFCGMIYNGLQGKSYSPDDVKFEIQKALQVRLIAQEMVK